MSIVFKDITYSVKNIEILKGISATIHPGEFVSIMGPSGSGKTSLLNIMSGRNADYSGTILCAGTSPTSIKSEIGFVNQNELLFNDLTVSDTLRYGVRLRCPHLNREEQDDRVDKIVEILGIGHILNRKIGDVSNKVLSGGEKKRVSIALELVASPPILFLDEPTSGLDATAASELILNLKALAATGTTVICTIHQPGRQLYKIFDKLLFIMNGCLVYYGTPKRVIKTIKHRLLPNKVIYDKYSHPVDCIVKTVKSDVTGILLNMLLIRDDTYTKSSNVESMNIENPMIKRERLGFFSAFIILLERAFMQSWRAKFDPTDLLGIVLIVTFQSIIWYQRLCNYNYHVLHETIIYAVIAIISLYRPGYTSIFFFTSDRQIIQHELEYGSYAVGTYYLAKTVSELPGLLINPTFYLCVLYFALGFPLIFESFIFVYLIIIVHGYTSNSIGLFISILCGDLERSAKILDAILPFLSLTCMLWSKELPIWAAWVQYISPMAAAYEAVYYNHLEYFIPIWTKQITNTSIISNTTALIIPVNTHFWFNFKWWYLLLILAWNFLYRIAAWVALVRVLKKNNSHISLNCCKTSERSNKTLLDI